MNRQKPDPDPLEAFVEDAQRVANSTRRRLVDRAREWVTGSLVSLLAGAVASGALAIVFLPVFAGVACALVTTAAVIYAIYARRLMDRERRMRRHAWIANKRLEQKVLKAETAVDDAVLALAGDREKGVRMVVRQRELGQAVRHLQSRARQAAREARPESPKNRRRQEKVPPAPDLAPVRRRQERRKAQIDALEAEIQALVVPDDLARQTSARKARRAERDLAHATREADRLARDRSRRGQSPTTAQSPRTVGLTIGTDGVRDVQSLPASPTPEKLVADAAARAPRP